DGRHLLPSVVLQQLLELRVIDPTLANAPKGEHECLTAQRGTPALGDPLPALQEAARALHEREAGYLEHLGRGVIGLGIAYGAEKAGRCHRLHAGYGEQVRSFRRLVQGPYHALPERLELVIEELDPLYDERDLVTEHDLRSGERERRPGRRHELLVALRAEVVPARLPEEPHHLPPGSREQRFRAGVRLEQRQGGLPLEVPEDAL